MKAYEKLKQQLSLKSNYLCIGLDTDIAKIPEHLGRNFEGMLRFNREIIEATKHLAVAYKMNFAFYEQFGVDGFSVLKKTFEAIPDSIFTIADAKRGDIGNTSKSYAKSAFDYFKADSITVNPYMGKDSVTPFLEFTDKITFILGLTSNPGSNDFQRIESFEKKIYRHVFEVSSKWGKTANIGYVVGATHPEELSDLRSSFPENVFLIPGVGTQGGDVKSVLKSNNNAPALINVSRDIIYSATNHDYIDFIVQKAIYYKDTLVHSA